MCLAESDRAPLQTVSKINIMRHSYCRSSKAIVLCFYTCPLVLRQYIEFDGPICNSTDGRAL